MITEENLEALGFHKIVWNNVMPEYWLPLFRPTSDQIRAMDYRLGVIFNERKDYTGPTVRLVVGHLLRLPHITEMDQLVRLYELLSGHPIEEVE